MILSLVIGKENAFERKTDFNYTKLGLKSNTVLQKG